MRQIYPVSRRVQSGRHKAVAAGWRAAPDVPHFDRVRDLVESLVAVGRLEGGGDAKIEAQQHIFEQLEQMGPAAVPAIVAHMDDRRPLAVGQISLRNRSPNAWEGIRHYGPDLVVDALDAILGQLTGRSFLTIVNGGTEEQRRAAVSAWRVHVHGMACSRPN